MITAGIKEARQHFTEYLSRVEKGEEIVISKRNKPIAVIKSLQQKRRTLESHKTLRASIPIKGDPLSQMIMESRTNAAY